MDGRSQDSIPQVSGDAENMVTFSVGNNDPVTCVLVTNTSTGPVHQLIQLPSESILVVNEQPQEDIVYNPQAQEVDDESTEETVEVNGVEINDGKFELIHSEPVENTDHSSAYYSKVFCRDCVKLFPTPDQLRDHNLSKHSDLFVCGVCLKGFNTTAILRQHMLTHSEKQFVCTFCSSTFSRASTLNKHICKRHGSKLANCEKCDKVREPNHICFKCQHCSASFKNKDNYEVHQCQKTKVFLCPYCGESFTRHAGLINHMLNQENRRKFECVVCKRRFNTKAQLRRHERGHVPEEWFNCEICETKYATASGFRLHNIKKHKHHSANALPPKSKVDKKMLHGKVPHTYTQERTRSTQVTCASHSKSSQTTDRSSSADIFTFPMDIELQDSSGSSPAAGSPTADEAEQAPSIKETHCSSDSDEAARVSPDVAQLLKCTEDVIISTTKFQVTPSE